MGQPPQCAALQAIQRVIRGMGDQSKATFTLETPPDPDFFQCEEGEEVHLLFAYPGEEDTNKKWWAHLLRDTPYTEKVEYQSFLHDGIVAATVANEQDIGKIHLYAVKLNLESLGSLEGEDPEFPVLPSSNPDKVSQEKGFCISGGVIRTRMYHDDLNHTNAGVFTDKRGGIRSVFYCTAKSSWINLNWQGSKSGSFGYKMLAGTQVCLPQEQLPARTRLLAGIQLDPTA